MKWIWDWRQVLQRAWSVRLMGAAALLSGVEVMLPIIGGDLPKGVFAALSFVVTAAALVARFVAQPRMDKDAQ